MTEVAMSAAVYQCDPCTRKEGRVVRELVRMVPIAMVVGDKMVGPEYFCCPICRTPKFDARTKKKVNAATTGTADDQGFTAEAELPANVTRFPGRRRQGK